ncbi:MAG: deoxynucleoside kinase [Pseudomonadota bacterium]
MTIAEADSVETTTGNIARIVARAREQNNIPNFVAVEGPIGVGKTTLATRLAQSFGYPTVLEPALENPFLDRFYREGSRHALPTQLFFLLNRARHASDFPQNDLLDPQLVTDFLVEKDALFAQLTLDENELALYQQIYQNLDIQLPKPDLVIYLQAPVPVLQNRIQRRGINFEQTIEDDYLSALIDRYTEFFHYYERAPLLVVNATEIDFAHNDDHFEALLQRIFQMEGTRQFFNPNPTLI